MVRIIGIRAGRFEKHWVATCRIAGLHELVVYYPHFFLFALTLAMALTLALALALALTLASALPLFLLLLL